jgi:hypothetical protein
MEGNGYLTAVSLTESSAQKRSALPGAQGYCVLLLSSLLIAVPARATPASGFGNGWVRDHPFTLMGLNIFAANLDVGEYADAGFNTLLAWEETAQQTSIAASGGLTWHAHIRPAAQGPDVHLQNLVHGAAASPGGLGWLLHDEPGYLHMSGIGEAATWIRTSYPGMPVYCNAFPSYASAEQLYGDASNPSYSFSSYLDDFIGLIAPDVLMYDHYPFLADGERTDGYYSDLLTVRSKALGANIPYWAFIQSWADANTRLPSESDLRMHIFTHLAAGYSGLAYFTYDPWDDGGLIDAAGAPTALYHLAADVNAEVLNLGHSLRYLTSSDVRYLRGEFMLLGMWLTDNPVPDGIAEWTAGAGGDPHIIAADVDSTDAANLGLGKDGVLGLFTDDGGRHYFMLVNAWHAADTSAADATLPFVVEFDSAVDALLELDRESGQEVVVPLTDHRLVVSIEGGSGRLFKYMDGPFAPDMGSAPDAGGALDGGSAADVAIADRGTADSGAVDRVVSIDGPGPDSGGADATRDDRRQRDTNGDSRDTAANGARDVSEVESGCGCAAAASRASLHWWPLLITGAAALCRRRRPAHPARPRQAPRVPAPGERDGGGGWAAAAGGVNRTRSSGV